MDHDHEPKDEQETPPTDEEEPQKVIRTKKAVVMEYLSRKGGATLEEMAERCEELGLGTYEQSLRTCKYLFQKLPFKVKKVARAEADSVEYYYMKGPRRPKVKK